MKSTIIEKKMTIYKILITIFIVIINIHSNQAIIDQTNHTDSLPSNQLSNLNQEIKKYDENEMSRNFFKFYQKKKHNKSHFSPWSGWSQCSILCKMRRERYCLVKRKCGTIKHVEEKPCLHAKCMKNLSKKYKGMNLSTISHSLFFNNTNGEHIFKIESNEIRKNKKRNEMNSKKLLPKREAYDNQNINQKITNKTGTSHIKNDLLKRSERQNLIVEQKPQKLRRVYSKWSRWSKCSTKCTTKRFKRCRIKDICGNEILSETAYCYVEGTFCQEWIKSQIVHIVESGRSFPRVTIPTGNSFTTTTTTTTSAPRFIDTSNYYNSNKRYDLYSRYNYIQPQPQIKTSTTTTKPNECPPTHLSSIYAPLNFRCGISNRTRARHNINNNWLKIIGGKPAGKGMHPWQVAVLNKFKEVFCGGTLVSSSWVLTAAHCVRRRLYVKLGVYNLNNTNDRNSMLMEISMSIKHPEYNKKTVDNDIAMLKLPESVAPRNNIGYICLPQRFQSLPVGSMCTIIGWGKMRNNDITGTNVLHAAEIPIISTEECKNVYIDYKITKNMFCAGHKRGRIDTCAGDSGGPLLCRDTSQYEQPWTIYGVTSFGDGCGKEEKFGIYTKLPNYVDWIWSIINCNGYCNNDCINSKLN